MLPAHVPPVGTPLPRRPSMAAPAHTVDGQRAPARIAYATAWVRLRRANRFITP